MSPRSRRIEYLARTIVNRLEDRSLVEFSDAERGIDVVVRALEEHFRSGEALETEARDRLTRQTGKHPSERELEEEIRRIASERGLL